MRNNVENKINILILGGGGFVGRSLNDYLSQNGRFDIETPRFEDLNLLDEESVKSFLSKKRYDVIINAAIYNPSIDPASQVSELEQDLRMFLILEKNHRLFGKMLYFGSGAEFDKTHDIVAVGENDFVNELPKTQYGMAKYTIGRIIEKSENIYNLRIFGLFGQKEGYRFKFISGACAKAVKGLPISIRQNVFFDYLYIDDFCRIVEWFALNNPIYHTYNVCSGKKYSLVELAEMVRRVSGKEIPVFVCKEGLANEYTASNARLLNEMPNMRFTEMKTAISDLYQYYLSLEKEIDLYPLLYQ